MALLYCAILDILSVASMLNSFNKKHLHLR